MAEIRTKQTNISITPDDFEYSGGAVTAIRGKILGGTGGTIIGNTYYGDEQTITIKQNNVISITDSYTSAYYTKNQTNENFISKDSYETKITEIDSGLAYLSANKQDDLSFEYYNNSISAINGSAINVNGNFYSASNPSGFVNSTQVGTQIDEKLQNYYLKTDTSGKDELSAAFNNIMKYNVTAQQGCDVTSAVDNGVTTFGISITATPVVTDTTLSGYNGIYAAPDGNTSGLWNVGLTQDMLNTINGKLNSVDFTTYTGTTAPNTYLTQVSADTLYQAKGNYISSANFDADKVYGYTIEGWTALDEGQVLTPGSGISIVDDAINAKIGTDLTFDATTSAIKIDTNGNPNNTATNNRNFVEGSWTVANGYNCHAEGAGTSALGYGVHAQGMWTCFSSSKWDDDKHIDTDIYWAVGAGAAVEGYCNATTSCPMSGTVGDDYGPVHGGIIKVIGNGYIAHDQQPDPDAHEHTHYPSDALILYRDGSLSAAGKISAAGIELGAEPDLSDYIPYSALNLPIGSNNTATNNAIAIGSNNTANNLGFAVGQSNTALKSSIAFGTNNYANDISLAIGYGNYASGNNNSNQSAVNIAIGYGNKATDHAASLINVCTAENYAFAAGHANSANDNSVAFGRDTTAKFYSFGFGHLNSVKNYSYAFGRDLHYEGQWANGSQYGAFVIGGWNATTSYATTADAPLFIIGNGSNGNRSDGFVVYRDGNVSAKQFQNADGTDTINGTTYNFTGVDNIEILPLAATANTANFPDDNVLRFILES